MGIKASLSIACCVFALTSGEAWAHGGITQAAPAQAVSQPSSPPTNQLQSSIAGAPTLASQPPAQNVAAPQTDTQSTPTDADQIASGEIIGMARCRSESIQKVPISIIAVTGATLKRQGIQDLKQFSSFAPSVSINSGRADRVGTTAQISSAANFQDNNAE